MTAGELVEDLRARGVTLEPRGDKLRVRPASRLAPDELDRLRAAKPEVLAYLAVHAPALAPVRHASAYAFPWPDAVPDVGPRRMGPYDPCSTGCGTWSWVRYGDHVLCLPCARRGPTSTSPASPGPRP